jgi:hypothetical protein
MATLKNTVIDTTGALQLPVGTTAQRPTADAGHMRYNSSFKTVETYTGTRWEYMPDIVRTGLVLNLDAGEPSSYSGSGTTWTDLSGNNFVGTLTNGPTYSSSNGGSIVFDGSNDYVRIPYNSNLNPTTITVGAWIKRNQVVNYAHFIGLPISNSTWNSPYMSYGVEYIGTTDTISFPLGFTDNTFAYTDAATYGNNIWFYFTGTYDKSNVKVYIDGVLITTRAETRTLYNSTADFYIGAINTSSQYPLNGNIAQVTIYNRALSASEIQQNYQALRGRFI